MNSIKKASLIVAVVAIAAFVCITPVSDEADAATAGFGTITYNSIDGYHVVFNEENDGGKVALRIDNHRYMGDIVGNEATIDGPELTSGTTTNVTVIVMGVSGETTVQITTATVVFNSNNGSGTTMSVVMSTGDNILPDFGWTGPQGEEFLGWGTTSTATSAIQSYSVPTDGATLYAVYGQTPSGGTTTVQFTPVTSGYYNITCNGVPADSVEVEVGTEIIQNENVLTIGDYSIEAVPEQGYSFASWSYEGTTVTEGMVIGAVFEQDAPTGFTITIETDGNGAVDVSSVLVTGDSVEITVSGTSLIIGETSVTATANDGYEFEKWIVGGQDYTGGTAVGDMTITATFKDASVGPGPGPEPDVYDVTVTSNDGAMGTASAEPASAEEGATVTLSYTANDGYRFVKWISDDVEITGDSFVMPAKDVIVTAVFEAIPPTEYTITVNQATGGTATASATTAIEGDVITLTATPDDGYVLDHWVINGDDVYRNTFTMPAVNVTVTPVFRALDNYDVTIEISGEGTVLNGGSKVIDGTVITVRELSDLVLTYTAGEDNYTVRCTVSDENARVSNASGTLTVSGISTDCTVTIEFVQGYMVSVNGGDHGEVSPGTGLQAENATVTYTVRPDSGYAVNRVLVDGQEVVVTGNQFQVDVGTSTHSIIVEYVFVGIVDDDDEEYVPPVVVVPKGDDDTTTYIVAIAAAAVVAILAALIMMQSRKS